MTEKFGKILMAVVVALLLGTPVYANNLSVTNVTIGTRNPGAQTIVVSFNVSWQNSWRTKINYDAAWLTVRLNQISTTAATPQVLCQVTATGLNPAGTSPGTGSNLQIYVPQDATGAFLQPSTTGFLGNVNSQNVQLTVNYNNCGFTNNDQIAANVFGLEMVFIPQGSFYAGDYNTSVASLNSGTQDSAPWFINSESLMTVANPISGGFQYVAPPSPNQGEFATSASFKIPAQFPNGYNSFYTMKYKINEGQWVQFVNSLALPTSNSQVNHDLSDSNHKNSTNVIYRNTVSCTTTGQNLFCSTNDPAREVSYLSWMDLAAFLDWDALRPMTELEYEKMARGPLVSNAGEYVWGNQTIAAATTISGAKEDGTETITAPINANANFGNATFSGGDASLGAGYNQGPLRGGIFAGLNSTRTSAGASYYGVMDLAGGLKERVVTIGNAAGLAFTGNEGTGTLTASYKDQSGNPVTVYVGNANVAGWPGFDASNPANGVDGATGSGFRGGSWADPASYLRISDRTEAARTDTSALNTYGGRGVRSYDGP